MTPELSQQLAPRLESEAKRNGMTPDAYAELLLRRVLPEVAPDTPNANEPRRAGSAKGKIIIPDDFDEPLDDFKEYMY